MGWAPHLWSLSRSSAVGQPPGQVGSVTALPACAARPARACPPSSGTGTAPGRSAGWCAPPPPAPPPRRSRGRQQLTVAAPPTPVLPGTGTPWRRAVRVRRSASHRAPSRGNPPAPRAAATRPNRLAVGRRHSAACSGPAPTHTRQPARRTGRRRRPGTGRLPRTGRRRRAGGRARAATPPPPAARPARQAPARLRSPAPRPISGSGGQQHPRRGGEATGSPGVHNPFPAATVSNASTAVPLAGAPRARASRASPSIARAARS